MDISALSEATSLDDERNGDPDTSPAHEGLLSALTNGVSQAPHGDNKFQSAISAWRNIDLTKLVPELDSTASDIISHQKEALLSRKDLAQKTKEFRKLDDASKLVEFKSLVKAYQTFIDLLTNHGKTTSSAFLQLYSSISEAPDPYPLLEASVDAQLLAEDTLPKLNAENEHLQKAVVNLTNLLDDSERKLGEERSARKEAEDSRDSRLKEVEITWKAVVEEKRDNWEAKERTLEEKIESQDRLINELKASFEVAQRLGHADSQGESIQNSASLAELEIVSSDLDKTSQRLAEVEARNEQLRLELAEASSNVFRNPVIDEDPVNERLRSENSSLLRKLETIRLEKESETRKRENKIRALERDAQKLLHDKESLRERLHSWRDYSDIKRELEIFKSVEFATLDGDETGLSSLKDGDEETENKQESKPGKDGKMETLEQLLLARNKKMSNEMALLRVSHQDLQQQLGSLREAVSTTNAELEQAQNLNAVLEADLAKVQQEASNNFPSSTMSTTGTYTSRYPTSNYPGGGRRGRASPTSSIISGFDPQSNSRSALEAIRAGEAIGGGSGILPMIQAQRDRFKQKNAQLEEELSKEHRIVSSLRQEIASLQKDNLNLYEKSRYVSTFNRGHQSSSASTYAPGPQSTIQITTDQSSGPSLDRYRSAYEANISPFAAFRGRESSRAYKRMSLPERIVYSITRMVLATRTSRNLFAAYCFALHVLVFVMLYWMQSVDIVKHASKLSDAASVVVAGRPIAGNRGADGQHGEWHQEGFTAEDR